MKIVLTLITYLASLALVSAAAFVIVVVLAGPHADFLLQPLSVAVLVLGWIAVLVLPVLAAWRVWSTR